MRFEKVKYTKEFQYHGISEWVGAELSIDEGDDPKLALHEAKKLAYEFYSEIRKEGSEPEVKKEQLVTDELKYSLQGINNASTLDELKGYWMLSKGNLILSEAYKTKLKSFEYADDKK
jgi:hypothetical protein